jgi:hypothetical protein
MVDQVFPVQTVGSVSRSVEMEMMSSHERRAQEGRITEVLGQGRFRAALTAGGTVEVTGRTGLKAGDSVLVVFKSRTETLAKQPSGLDTDRPVAQWAAFLPLNFGGPKANARIRVYTAPDAPKQGRSKKKVVLFVFETTTRSLGRIEWGVHLRAREVAFQVYAEGGSGVSLKALTRRAEESLRARGFTVSAPTVFLKKPFGLPAGYTNVRG